MEHPAPPPYRSPLPLFLLGVVLFSLLGAAAFEAWYRCVDGSRRNPLFRRAWVEHVRRTPPAQPGEHLVLLISHSQGWGREVTDAETYAALLEAELRARAPTALVRVVNWSVPAVAAPGFTILAAAAHRLRPAQLLFVASADQFCTRTFFGMDGTARPSRASDLYYLLGYRDVRSLLPRDFTSRFYDLGAWLDIGLGRCWPGWRARTLPAHVLTRWDMLKPFAKNDQEPVWFGPRQHRRVIRQPMPSTLPETYMLDTFLAVATGAAPRVTWINTPVHSRWREEPDPGIASIAAACRSHGATFHDAQAALPDDAFFTATHLEAAGHRLMAAYLAGVITP